MSDGEPLLLLRVCTLPVETLAPFAADRASETLTAMLASESELDRLSEALAGALHHEAGAAPAGDSEWARARHALLRLRRDVHNRRALEPDALGRVGSRLSPGTADALADWERARTSVDEARARFRTAYAGDRERAWTALSAWARDDRFQEGLRLVSGSLLGKVERLTHDPPADWGHRERHAALKALAYLARFATKTSPNGVFCATALATWCDRARCEGENRLDRLVYLLSVAEARKISACLAVTTEVEAAIVPRANPSLRATEGTWTFWKPASPRHPDDCDVLTRIKQNSVAQAFLDEAGELPVSDLLERVGSRCGFASGSPELRAFFDRLVGHGLLIAEIEVPYRSPRPLRELVSAIASHATPPWLGAVAAIEESVDDLADEPWPARRLRLDRLERELESLPHRRPLHGDELFKVDAATELAVSLPRSLIAELESFLHWYARVYAALYPERLFRAAYAHRFLERYPSDVEVEALDLYHGLFEPQDLARPWGFPEPPGTGPIADACKRKFARVRDAVADAARGAEAAGLDEIALDPLDWDSLLDRTPEPSWSCGLLFQVAAASAGDVSADRYRLIVSAIYPGAGLASARLARLHARNGVDPITDELRRASHAIERDGTVVAEITYMHGGRTANAGLRPTVVPREIELPGDRCTPGVESFPLRDLTVRYDSSRERFVLRSRSRGQELRPILSSGISPEGFVSFLLAIGRQDLQQPLGSFPGFEAPSIRRWPRMRWGRIVVFRRRWDLPIAELRAMRTSRDGAAAFESVQRWRAREGVPRRVFVASSREPKPFFVDLESPPFLELLDHHVFANSASADEFLHVTEMLPGPEHSWVNDARGRYASEFLVHLQNVADEPRTAEVGRSS